MNFAIVGMGFIAERHIRAIKHIGGEIICWCDKDWDNIIDTITKCNLQHRLSAILEKSFVEWEDMFESYAFEEVDYVVILTPNYLHYSMIKKARLLGKKVICEKPLVLDLNELELLKEDKEIYTTLQLRYAFPILKKLKTIYERNEIRMNIEVHRGAWYYNSWKVDLEKSGGLIFNIGIHYFDLLNAEFGPFKVRDVSAYNDKCMEGMIESNSAIVRWKLKIDAPIDKQRRDIKFAEGHKIDLTGYTYGTSRTQVDFTNLHNKAYENIIKGEGVRPADLISVTKLVSDITNTALEGRRRRTE